MHRLMGRSVDPIQPAREPTSLVFSLWGQPQKNSQAHRGHFSWGSCLPCLPLFPAPWRSCRRPHRTLTTASLREAS